MNYAQNLQALAQLCGDAAYEQDPDFVAILPVAIQAAENRILRDLDLLSARVTDEATATQNSRTLVLPIDQGVFLVVEVVRPVVSGVSGQPMLPTGRETIDMLYPSEVAPSQPSIPQFWAPLDQENILIGPPPDQNYPILVYGTMRPTPLSSQTPGAGTFISTQLPDLFIAAEMAWLSGGWLKNWSPQADDAASAVNWEGEYRRLRDPALVQEIRAKVQANGWTTRLPSPIASPPQK